MWASEEGRLEILAIAAVLVPALQSAVQTDTLGPQWKGLTGLLIAVVVGGIIVDVSTARGFVITVLAVWGAGQLGYYGLFKPTGADEMIERNVRLPIIGGRA